MSGEKVFILWWGLGGNNADDLNSLLADDYHVGSFAVLDGGSEKGKVLFVLHSDDGGDEWDDSELDD